MSSAGVDVQEAIRRGREALLGIQYPDGAYRACNEGGPASTALAVVAIVYLGAAERFPLAGAVRFFRSQQLENGSFAAFPGDTRGSLAAACACYAGMFAARVPVSDPAMKRAWRYIYDHGGFESADPVTQAYLAAAGLFNPTWLPDMPLAVQLLPGARRLLGRVMIAPLHLLGCALMGLVKGLKRRRKTPTPRESLIGWMETTDLIGYLKGLQDPSGSWMGTLLHTTTCAMTLHALGLPTADAAIARAVAHLADYRYVVADESPGQPRTALGFGGRDTEDGAWQFNPFCSETWNTAQAVYTLRSAGVPASDPRVADATVFLLSTQGRRDQPREWQGPSRRSPRRGGWSFEPDNQLCLDCDSTGMVLRALGTLKERSGVREAVDEGLDWLFGMQNADGGFPAFTHGLGGKPAGSYPLGLFALGADVFDNPRGMRAFFTFLGDPSTEDLTGRVLAGVGAVGVRPRDRKAVDKAVRFLEQQISDNGAWWGRWECNFVPGSAYVLSGLAAVGVSADLPWIRRAVRWVEEQQHEDGGFGEDIESYANLGLVGHGESNAYCTGLALSALVAMRGRKEVIERAARYLMAIQQRDGLWPAGSYRIVLNNPLPFYTVPSNVWTAPLQGLADYRAA